MHKLFGRLFNFITTTRSGTTPRALQRTPSLNVNLHCSQTKALELVQPLSKWLPITCVEGNGSGRHTTQLPVRTNASYLEQIECDRFRNTLLTLAASIHPLQSKFLHCESESESEAAAAAATGLDERACRKSLITLWASIPKQTSRRTPATTSRVVSPTTTRRVQMRSQLLAFPVFGHRALNENANCT